MKKKGLYVPKKRYNPAQLSARYDVVVKNLEKKTQIWEMEKAGIKSHFSKITNFTSHDVKNAIQNMDAVVSTLDINNVTREKVDTIKSCLNAMRASLDDFYRLSFEGQKSNFTLAEIAKLVELLNKASLSDAKIAFSFDVDQPSESIHQPFHSILQVANNLMINSITAFNPENTDKRIYINYGYSNDNVQIMVYDNAQQIREDLKEKIFEIYYSTTGGTGIGLAHAQHLLEILGGSIELCPGTAEYCTNFVIKFPTQSNA